MLKNLERFNDFIDNFTGLPPESQGEDLNIADEAIERLLFNAERGFFNEG